jgi:hypothetical protein
MTRCRISAEADGCRIDHQLRSIVEIASATVLNGGEFIDTRNHCVLL